MIAPNSIGQYAPEGVDIHMGAELLQKLKDAVGEHCPEPNAPNCHGSVLAVLDERTVGIQSRVADVMGAIGIAVAAIVAAIAHALSADPNAMEPTDKFHLSPEDVTQINNIDPSTTEVEIVTGDSNPVVVHVDADP